MGLLAIGLLAGCIDDGPATDAAPLVPGGPLAPLVTTAMTFSESVVAAAMSVTNDLYEPTLEVSDTGVIYITAHTIVADTTGAPAFMSHDDGATWSQLPFLGPLAMPEPVHGATPPPSDEMFLVAGDDGWLYGVDITLATFPVNAWSGDGAQLAYHNPNAYDERQSVLQASDCIPVPVKDRPWAAYANGTLLMVSNPAAGPAQIGVLAVPPILPLVGEVPVGLGTGLGGWWNLCAGLGIHAGDSSIPGIPDIRPDGLFAVPQRGYGVIFGGPHEGTPYLYLIMGNKQNIFNLDIRPVFPHTTGGEITSVYGHAVFDADGTLFVGITNNTALDADGNRTGRFRLAVSTDSGETFTDRIFTTGRGAPVRHIYMDANEGGPGALVVWAVDGDERDAEGNAVTFDWYVAHLHVDADGRPGLHNVALAIDEGPQPSAHVTGAAVGPDGRAYLATFVAGGMGSTPLSVWVQQDGPTLPVTQTR
jgi:hypothetical protein